MISQAAAALLASPVAGAPCPGALSVTAGVHTGKGGLIVLTHVLCASRVVNGYKRSRPSSIDSSPQHGTILQWVSWKQCPWTVPSCMHVRHLRQKFGGRRHRLALSSARHWTGCIPSASAAIVVLCTVRNSLRLASVEASSTAADCDGLGFVLEHHRAARPPEG